MNQTSRDSTFIVFQGIQLTLPSALNFYHEEECLVLNFSKGFSGKLTLRPVSTQLTFPSPTFQLTAPSQPQNAVLEAPRQAAEQQLSQQQPDLSQGGYPLWMLQSSNPAGCIPDSLGTQSPWQKNRPSQALPGQDLNISPQLRAANAAALQDLMTQVDPSEADLDADDAPSNPTADADMQEDIIQSSAQAMDMLGNASASHTAAVKTNTPQPPGGVLQEGHPSAGRGAGTPAGPLEEFYSPQEHLQPDSLETSECATVMPSLSAAKHPEAASITEPEGEAAALCTAETRVPAPTLNATPSSNAATAEAAAVPAVVPAATQSKTPKPAMQTKTPAHGKHRLTSSVPPSSKRRKAAAADGALAEASFSWRSLEAEWALDAALPEERWGSTLTHTDQHQVLLLGGSSPNGLCGDAWMLDLGNAEPRWTPLPGAACGRAWHSALLLPTEQGQQMVMFGGECSQQQDENAPRRQNKGADLDEEEAIGETVNHVAMLEPDFNLWVDLPISGQQGKAPPRRAGHTCTVLPNGELLVFGGSEGGEKYKNDVFLMNIKRLTWFKMQTKGAPPKPRAYHTATLMGNRLIVMGGLGKLCWSLKEVYSLNIDTWKWSEHTAEVEGEAPSPRYGHAAVALPDKRHLVTFGGSDGDDDIYFSSIAVLDTYTWRWTTAKAQGLTRPCGRSGHGIAIALQPDNKAVMVVHGGRSKGDVLHNDTWLLELPPFDALGQ